MTVIIREVAATQVSVPGQSLLFLHHRPLSEHICAGWPSAQKSPGRAVLQEGSAREAQVVFAVTTPCLHEPHWLAKKVLQGEPASQQVSADSGRPAPSFEEMA